jgi:hypothetical protein
MVSAPPRDTLTMQLKADPRHLITARLFSVAVARQARCDDASIEDLKLAVSEAVSMAIEEGAERVDLQFSVEERGLGVQITHRPDALPRPGADPGSDPETRLGLIQGLFRGADRRRVDGTIVLAFSVGVERAMSPRDDTITCPVCGRGTLVDITFTDAPSSEDDGMQTADSRQVETFSCGHERLGPPLSKGAEPADGLEVERRTSEETTEAPGEDPSLG